MPRSLWTGAISFGLVNIPVKLYSATQDSGLDLDMLDSRDHSNIKFKRVNENTGKEVPFAEIVKGYKYHEHYVVLDKEDFESADAKKTKTIEIMNFSLESEVDSMLYEQPYYLEPDKSGVKAYAILREALAASGKVAVATFVLRNKEGLALLKPHKKVIVLNRIRFAEEIREISDLKLPDITKSKTKEHEMAIKLVAQLTEKFDVSKYHDTYTNSLLKIIKSKSKGGKKPAAKKLKIVHTRKSDLMSVLEASLANTSRKKIS